MAKTLDEFLESRAQDDFRSAEVIFKHASKCASFESRVSAIHSRALMHGSLSLAPSEDTNIFTTKRGLHRAALMMLSVAGEATKKLEKAVPDIRAKVPNFPFEHLKELRDLNIKFGESARTGEEIDAITLKINKEVEALNEMPEFDVRPHKHLPYFYLIAVCMKWATAIEEFKESSPSEDVLLTPSPALKKLAGELGFSQAAVPVILEALAARDVLNVVHDQIKQPSIFFRKLHPKMFVPTVLEPLKQLRHKYAHFEDFFEMDSQTTPDAYTVSITTLVGEEARMLRQVCSQINAQMPKVATALHYDACPQYASQMASDYKMMLLGTAYYDDAKKAVMDEMVEWVTRNRVKKRSEDAFVIATGDLLQRATPADAKALLQYVCSRKNSFGTPQEMLEGMEGLGHSMQASLKSFVQRMQYGLGIQAARSPA